MYFPPNLEKDTKKDLGKIKKRGKEKHARNSETTRFDRQKPSPPGWFPIYYVPPPRTVSKRNPLEEFVPGASRGVPLLTDLDEGT